MFDSAKNQRKRDLANALASISNALWTMQHKPGSWDERIKMVQNIQAILPTVIRYFLYFKNTETHDV